MENKIKLTDQELNEWVCLNIMGWAYITSPHEPGKSFAQKKPIEIICNISPYHSHTETNLELFDPCQDLNHTRLMENKIRDFSEIELKEYCCNLFNLIEKPENDDILFTNQHFECYLASARIRCEAAYITFK